MGYAEEFSTVDLVLSSKAETFAVDAFVLSRIKAERQARKLLTYLVYQSPAFGKRDVPRLRQTLASNRNVYFDGVVRGINMLSPVSVAELVGPDYDRLWGRFVSRWPLLTIPSCLESRRRPESSEQCSSSLAG